MGVPPDYADYVQLMFDMLVLAFQTDSTRVATLMLAHDGSNRSFDQIGISEGHHDLTHHQNRPDWISKVADIDLWYVRQFARFLEKLQSTKDIDGKSLLHNSMIVYGSGNADANRHTHNNLPIVLAGGGGGTLTPGRYVKHGSKPLTNLLFEHGRPPRTQATSSPSATPLAGSAMCKQVTRGDRVRAMRLDRSQVVT